MKIKLIRDRIEISGNTFILDRVKNLDDLVDQVSDDEFNKDERLPYWAELWPSALALTEYILNNGRIFKDKKVIELGCGMGLTTMALMKMQPKQLVATDYEQPALDSTLKNFNLNKMDNLPRLELLDWRVPQIDEKFEVIIASDIAYEERFFRPLIDLFHLFLSRNGVIIIAEPNRSIARSFFGKLALAGFQYSCIEIPVNQSDKNINVSVYHIRK